MSAGLGFDVQLRGAPELTRALKDLSSTVRRRVVRQAVSKALTPINRATKNNLDAGDPEEKAIRKAIGKVVRTYRHSGVIYGAVGVRKQFDDAEPDKALKPSNLLGLLEVGTDRRPATRPLSRAIEERKGEALGILERELRANIEKEAAKAAAKAGSKR